MDALVCRFSYDTFFPQKSLMTRTGSGRKVHHINHCTVMFDTTSLYFQRNTSKITNGRCRFGCCNTSSTTMFCSVSSPKPNLDTHYMFLAPFTYVCNRSSITESPSCGSLPPPANRRSEDATLLMRLGGVPSNMDIIS